MCGYHLGREELGKIVRREYIQQELNPAIQLLLRKETYLRSENVR